MKKKVLLVGEEANKVLGMDGEEKELKMEPLPDYGDLMTLEDWLDCVECGGFIDYDGQGRYATDKEMSNKYVVPSDVKKGKIDKSWTHVMWFNR